MKRRRALWNIVAVLTVGALLYLLVALALKLVGFPV
jgi:hypothetical protein